MPELTISDRDQQMLDDMRRYNLRHPCVVEPRILKLCKRDSFNSNLLADIRLEWLKLGLDKQKEKGK